MNKLLFISILVLSSLGCNSSSNNRKQDKNAQENNVENECLQSQSCDSVYTHKNGLLLCLKDLGNKKSNYAFQVFRPSKNGCKTLFSDSIFSKTGKLKFEDFNNDGTLDVLIQNNSDVRSNWTYNLYLIENSDTSIRMVKDFSRIKNPKPISNSNLVESYVVSGNNYYEYFRILDDFSLCQYDTTIYEDHKSEKQTDWESEHGSLVEKLQSFNCSK